MENDEEMHFNRDNDEHLEEDREVAMRVKRIGGSGGRKMEDADNYSENNS